MQAWYQGPELNTTGLSVPLCLTCVGTVVSAVCAVRTRLNMQQELKELGRRVMTDRSWLAGRFIGAYHC